MTELKLETLDIKNEAQLLEYEMKMFNAFSSPKSWIGENYQKISNDRIRSYIPYSQQMIFIINENDHICAASAVNLDMDQYCQIEQMGYNFSKYKKPHVCEGIGFFTVPETKINRFEMGALLTTGVFNILKDLGYTDYYGTSSKELVKLYVRLYSFEIIDLFQSSFDEKYLLYKKL